MDPRLLVAEVQSPVLCGRNVSNAAEGASNNRLRRDDVRRISRIEPHTLNLASSKC